MSAFRFGREPRSAWLPAVVSIPRSGWVAMLSFNIISVQPSDSDDDWYFDQYGYTMQRTSRSACCSLIIQQIRPLHQTVEGSGLYDGLEIVIEPGDLVEVHFDHVSTVEAAVGETCLQTGCRRSERVERKLLRNHRDFFHL